MYDAYGAQRDEEFSESLKARKARNAEQASLIKSRLGKRPDRPMLVDFRQLEALGVKLRRYNR
mgnify:CR=1 FL=1